MENFYDKITMILQQKFFKQIYSENKDNLNFFGSEISLSASDMIYLVVLLENEYSIKFTDEDFDDEKFYTMKGMYEILSAHSCS